MTRSLGLTLYGLVAGRGAAEVPAWPARPPGRLVWLHAPAAGSGGALAELARRLREEDGHPVVLTSDKALPPQAGVIVVPPPAETSQAVQAFLDHWRPDLGVISDGELRPLLLTTATERGLPLLLVDGRAPYLPDNRLSVWPGLLAGLLGHFTTIHVIDTTAARQFRRRGAPEATLRIEGRMAEGSHVLPCTEAERAALVRQFQTRPVWLAAGLPVSEEAAVIAAHRKALRMAHRLLLILVPADPERSDPLALTIAAEENWRVARRSAEEEPDAETEVYIADAASEMGLWYRLAPITFMGGSLYGGGSRRDPFEAAALGSAILHGPQPGPFTSGYARLVEAGSSRPVSGPTGLAEGLSDLLSPDRAARLAQGAWAVASAGADVTDRIILEIRALLEAKA